MLAINAGASSRRVCSSDLDVIMSSSFERRLIGRVVGRFSYGEKREERSGRDRVNALGCLGGPPPGTEQQARNARKTLKENLHEHDADQQHADLCGAARKSV